MNITESVKNTLKEILLYLVDLLNKDPMQYKILTLYIPIAIVSLIIMTCIFVTIRSHKKEKQQ